MISAVVIAILQAATPYVAAHGPQDVPSTGSADSEVYLGEIVVTGRRRGDTGLDPEQELGVDEIYALGAYDVGEVVGRLAETFSPEGAPIIVVNGRRLANASDFLRFPPDALMRVEALPAEAAGLFGGDAGQRVINIVMRPQFRSRDAFVAATVPTAGGTTGTRGDLRQSEIRDEATLQFGVEGSRVTALWSDERPDTEFDPRGAPARTRAPNTRSFGANLVASRPIGEWSANFGISGSFQDIRSTERTRAGAAERLDQSTDAFSVNSGLTGEIWDWDVRASLNTQLIQSEQEGLLTSSSDYRTLSGEFGLGRRVFSLPAGPARLSLSSRHEFARSDVSLNGSDFVRSTVDHDARASLNLPVLGAGKGNGGLGSAFLTLGARARADGSFEGGNGGLSAALSWSPRRKLRLNARWSKATDSPQSRQLLDPLIQSPTRLIYDFLTGRATEVVTFSGGNPDLRPETSTDASAGFLVGPVGSWQVSGGATLSRNEIIDDIASLPGVTPETEAAFPERFVRGPTGTLESIDLRPVNIARSRQDSLSSTFNLNVPLHRYFARSATLRLSLRHTFQLDSLYVIREGSAEFDRLAGDAGGQVRHQFAATLDGRAGRWGLNAGIQQRGGYRIRRDAGQDGADDLVIDPTATVDLRLSYKLTQSAPPSDAGPGRRNDTAVDLAIDNVFDSRLTARRGDGLNAPGYGRYDRDPIGRAVTVTLTKRF